MEKYIVIVTLFILSPESFAFQDFDFGGGSSGESEMEATEAFACSNCTLSQARAIAINHAPTNSCDIYRNGSNAQYCESVSKHILVPVHGSQNVHKFIVTTSIDSNNRPNVNVISFFLTSTESQLMDEYFYQYGLIEQAVANASLSSSQIVGFQSNTNSLNFLDGKFSASKLSGDSCANHPITILSSDRAQADKKLELTSTIIEDMNGSSPIKYSSEFATTGAGLGVSASGASMSIQGQYLQNNLIATVGDNNFNVLAFDVHISHNPTTKVNQIGLTINRLFTKIDGIQMSDLFAPEFDLTEYKSHEISDCLDEFIENETEASDDQGESGGNGTEDDPYSGGDIAGKNDPTEFCKFIREAKSCSTTTDGHKTCTLTKFIITKPCNSFP